MTKSEAISLALRLKDHFPRTSDGLIEEWVTRLLAFNAAVAHQCVDRYVEKYEELRTSALIGHLRDATNRVSDPRADAREQDRCTQAAWAIIDAAIAEMPDEVLAEQKRRVLEQMPEKARAFHASRDPRKSIALKSLIAVQMGLGAPYVDGPTGERIHRN